MIQIFDYIALNYDSRQGGMDIKMHNAA